MYKHVFRIINHNVIHTIGKHDEETNSECMTLRNVVTTKCAMKKMTIQVEYIM